jgi:hypothetical protein
MALNRQMRPNSGTAGHLSKNRAARCPIRKVPAAVALAVGNPKTGCQPPASLHRTSTSLPPAAAGRSLNGACRGATHDEVRHAAQIDCVRSLRRRPVFDIRGRPSTFSLNANT